MNFSLLLPTRERPRLAKRLLESIQRTTRDLNAVEIILCLDEDDGETEALFKSVVTVSTVRSTNETMGLVTRRCYDQARGKWIMLLNDDMVFHTRGWDDKVVRAFAQFPDEIALVYGNDLYYASKMCTFPILTRQACELMDKICPAQYKRHCIDPHIFDIFAKLAILGHERRKYLKDVIFEHMLYNPAVMCADTQTMPQDDDDQEIYFSFSGARRQIAERMVDCIASSCPQGSGLAR